MKTKFTTLAMLIFICLGIVAHGEQKKSGPGKQNYLIAKKALQANPGNTGQFKHLFIAVNELSMPGNSEDYSWEDESNDWQHVSNTTYTYNNTGKLTEEISRDAETNYYLTRNTYSDDPNYISEEVSYTWIIDGWIPVAGERSSKTLSAESPFEGYNNGILYQNLENEVWVNKTWIKYILDQHGIPTQLYEYHWNENNWMEYSRTGLLTWADWPNRELAAYTKQYMQGYNWVNAERVSKQYDGDNYTLTTEIWENEHWVNSTRETYTLTDTEEELILENWTTNGWVKTEIYRGTFDNLGNPTGMQYNSWFGTDWVVIMELFFDLTYNETNDVTEMVFRYQDPELSEPVNISKYIYSNFHHFTTDVPEISDLHNINVFPNPVRSTLTVQIDENKAANYQVNIVNIAGQTVFSNNYSDTFISIDAGGFNPGMYLINIKSNEGWIYNRKFLKN